MAEPIYNVVKEYTSTKIEIIIMLLVLFVVSSYFFPEIRMGAYIAAAGIVLIIVFQLLAQSGIVIEVAEYKRAVVFRMGHYHRVDGPGWVLIIPLLEKAQVLDLRLQTLNLPPQEVITTDEIKTTIDTSVYYQIVDPKKAVLKVKDFSSTIESYVFGALRDVASDLTLNELFGEIEKVNDLVKVKIQPLVSEWGMNLVDVTITNVQIPENIQYAMHLRRKAREEWAASQYEARAQKTRIEALGEAAKKLDQNALNYLYLREALPKIAEGKSTKIFFPAEFSQLAAGLAGGDKSSAAAAATALYPLALKKIGEELDKEKPKKEKEEKES